MQNLGLGSFADLHSCAAGFPAGPTFSTRLDRSKSVAAIEFGVEPLYAEEINKMNKNDDCGCGAVEAGRVWRYAVLAVLCHDVGLFDTLVS